MAGQPAIVSPLFPHWPVDEVPVGHVTNGVHMPTWDSAAADELWTKACGKDRWLGMTEKLEQDIRSVSDETSGSFAAPPSASLNTPAIGWPGIMPPPALPPKH
jgi:starch phosphorylase